MAPAVVFNKKAIQAADKNFNLANEKAQKLLATNIAGKARKEDHLWTQNGAGKGGTWKKARVAAPRGSRLVFRGTVGPASKAGYIALDDISVIENDRCKTLPKGAGQEPVASLLSCDFNGGDLCRWFSKVQNGATKWAFGPPEGSTLGPVLMPKNGEGGMIYVNGSILLTNNNNVDLRSSIVGPQQEAGCFSFWYHVFAGRDTQLELYQRKAEESDEALTQFRVLFRHSDRTMADRWYNARLTVLLDAKINQFAFFSTLAHNTANAAVIALGPLDYTPGACDVFTDAKGYCDFEFDQCGWISTDGWKRDERPSELDDLHHHIRSGPVNSVYVLKAAELSGKKITTVTSPEWPGQTEPQCLEFWYTRTGPAGAELQAELLVSNKSQVIWKRPPTLEWMLARVPIVQKKTFQVVFRATFPAPAWRTLSLDNVALRPEPCIHPANCDFVEGLCGYVNSFRRDFRWLIGHGRLENPELQPSVPIPQGVFSSFAYLDLSSNAFMYSRQEKTVGLLSPFFDIGDDQTAIGFQYFRNGPDIAKANLSVSCYSDGKPNSIETQYSAELHEVTEWTELNVPLKQGLNCQLAVWVIKGDGTNGAIAIHSVKVQQKDSTPKSNKDTATHCTFDKGTMCGWSSDGGLMTWTLNDPAKKVPGYPRFDHTQRAYKGRFIFVENKNTSYKSAVLKSPVLDVQSTDGACLSLWHIAQHTFNGRLSVYELISCKLSNLRSIALIPSRSITVYYGDQHLLTTITRTSHRWQHALAEFKVPAGSLQLQIEVSIGRGLIALDDLHIAAGPCPQTDFCSWEMDSPCVVNQDPGNVTPWTRCEGKNVGIPDHTHDSLEGSYLYINTTALNSHHPMSRAFLPRRDPTEATCVTFWWRAHGAASQLNVYRFTKETALRDPLVSLRTHSGGDWWNVRTITVTSGTQWNLVFEVVAPAGEKHQSGVMIDDVEFTDGQCPPYNLCTFENECLPWKLSTKGDWETRFEVQRAESFKKLSKDHSTATSDGE
ncbi:MAM and LDL-receptor class A domain-containing protein 1-like [Dermacentor silvarum]|uniref:MAM and LDL-receptor class A domain-containing protein 1-like n=1 Tax=Dermacentor silvarum TaxID=543639 RepID=UPI002101BA8B|nr:MAM and LDL-receptor class A domain-containing protein 1-like [Dermacentor silvarum]